MKKRKINRDKFFLKDLASENMSKLFSLAENSKEFANRYVFLARNIGKRFRVSVSSQDKRKYCKHCYSFFRVGENCRVRLRGKKIVYSCFSCKKFTRKPYIKERKK